MAACILDIDGGGSDDDGSCASLGLVNPLPLLPLILLRIWSMHVAIQTSTRFISFPYSTSAPNPVVVIPVPVPVRLSCTMEVPICIHCIYRDI